MAQLVRHFGSPHQSLHPVALAAGLVNGSIVAHHDGDLFIERKIVGELRSHVEILGLVLSAHTQQLIPYQPKIKYTILNYLIFICKVNQPFIPLVHALVDFINNTERNLRELLQRHHVNGTSH